MNEDLFTLLTRDLKLPEDRLTPEASLDDAGFDSLAIVELSVLLTEQLGVEVTDTEIKDAGTLTALDNLVAQKRTGR
ncbi:acyl carrier protein [Streptomyces sp. NPDC046977]|uniref:acyl carrier protein n=1 Tax=Streptomyces sp. NPDC046977 TaxID=3154703 RepID=UPI0033E7DB06